jgi:FSR family fosmidomycin resistance protein-like MFS transporter
VAFGPVVAALFLSGIGLAPSYGALVALLMIGGIGVAAFHPQGAVLAAENAASRSVAMSIFITGGTLGFSLGPLFAVWVAGRFGIDKTWIAALPGLVVALVFLAWFARRPAGRRDRGPRPALAELRPVLRPLALLYGAVVFRSAVSYGFLTFLPLHLHARGYSLSAGGAMVAAYAALGAMGGFLGGWLAGRWGGRRVVVTSFLLAAPLYFGFVVLPGAIGLVSLVCGSFALQSSLPVNVVLGQELSPRHASTISSLLMGAAWGVGALLIGPIGALADARGIPFALGCLAATLVLGFLCAALLPIGTAEPTAASPPAVELASVAPPSSGGQSQ